MALDEATKKEVSELIAAANKPLIDAQGEITKNLKVIGDTLAADAKAKADADAKAKADADTAAAAGKGGEKKPEPITAEAAAKIAADAVTKALADRDAAAKGTAEREKFIAEKLKDVPDAYHGKLGNDPAKWAAEEQVIRDGLKKDLEKLGVKPKDVSGGNTGGTTTGGATATEKVTAFKAQGLSDGEADFAANLGPLPTK